MKEKELKPLRDFDLLCQALVRKAWSQEAEVLALILPWRQVNPKVAVGKFLLLICIS